MASETADEAARPQKKVTVREKRREITIPRMRRKELAAKRILGFQFDKAYIIYLSDG